MVIYQKITDMMPAWQNQRTLSSMAVRQHFSELVFSLFLITVCTLGIAYPYALVLKQRWKAKHTYDRGFRLKFTGTGLGLFGNWIKWLFLCVITLGIYGFWIGPRFTQWVVEHTDFDEKKSTENS